MAQAPPKELLTFLKPYDRPIRELTLGVREYVIAELAPCHEYVLDTSYTLALCFSSTARVIKDGICTVAVYPAHVNLMFPRGTELDDPLRLLKGEGKKMRHISIKSLSDLSHPEIRELMRRARDLVTPAEFAQPHKKQVISVVKGGQKKKRYQVSRKGR